MAGEFEDFVNSELPKRLSTSANPTGVTKGMLPVTSGVGLGVEFKTVEEVALQGPEGKSSYQAAVEGGYTGSEVQFNAQAASLATSVVTATEQATKAETAASVAEAARDTFNLNVGRKASVDDGLATTTNGQSFTVLSENDNLFIVEYKNNNGVAQEVKSYPSAALTQNLKNKVDKMDAWGKVYEAVADYSAPSAIFVRKPNVFINIATGVETTSSAYTTYTFDVVGGEDVYLSAKILGTSSALATFFDKDGIYLGYYLKGKSGVAADAISYVNERVDVPLTASKLSVSAILSSDPAVLNRRVIESVSLKISRAEEKINTSINQTILPSISELSLPNVPQTLWTEGFYVAYNTGAIIANAGYGYEIHDVTPGENVYLSGAIIGNATALAVFFDSANKYMGFIERAPTGTVPSVFEDLEVSIPSKVVKLALCQPPVRHTTNPVTLKRMKPIMGIGDRLSALENAGNKFWADKSVVWLGNSIPAGTVAGGKYPELLCKNLGASLTNEAVSGSAWRAGVRSRVTETDTLGLAGSPWQAVLWSLSMTIVEKQNIIDNWSTIGPTLGSTPPATLTQAQKTQALACCYENKLISNHLGNKRKDFYVFDNPYNDRAMSNDIDKAGKDTQDRLTYLGAVNFLINLIMTDNPKARIVFVGHYENKLYPNLFGAQEIAASTWSAPIIPLADSLRWSQQTITTTGYWVSGLWVDSGGASQSITLLERWLPDKVHPGNDFSGEAINRIVDVLTPLFNLVR